MLTDNFRDLWNPQPRRRAYSSGIGTHIRNPNANCEHRMHRAQPDTQIQNVNANMKFWIGGKIALKIIISCITWRQRWKLNIILNWMRWRCEHGESHKFAFVRTHTRTASPSSGCARAHLRLPAAIMMFASPAICSGADTATHTHSRPGAVGAKKAKDDIEESTHCTWTGREPRKWENRFAVYASAQYGKREGIFIVSDSASLKIDKFIRNMHVKTINCATSAPSKRASHSELNFRNDPSARRPSPPLEQLSLSFSGFAATPLSTPSGASVCSHTCPCVRAHNERGF